MNKINCNSLLHKRKIIPSPNCPHCKCEEDILHILRDCQCAMIFWSFMNQFITRNFKKYYETQDIHEWITVNCNCSTHLNMHNPWNIFFFCFAIWHLWLNKNSRRINPQQATHKTSLTPQTVNMLYTEFTYLGPFKVNTMTSLSTPLYISWSPHIHPYIKLNKHGKGGIGGIFRDGNEKWL